MDLQKKLIELSRYDVTFNVSNDKFVIKVKYDNTWTVIPPEDERVSFYRDESDGCVFYYVAPITINLEDVFSAIDELITYNLELEDKVKLFNERLVEMQQLFASESLDVLKTLEFKVKKKKTRSKNESNEEKEIISKNDN